MSTSHLALLRALSPWHRRQAPAPRTSIFDARLEQGGVGERMLRQAARLLAAPVGDDGAAATARAQAFCDALVASSAHLPLCWTWFGDPAVAVIVPQIAAGRAADYAHGLCIGRNWITARGPAFGVLHGRRVEPFNVSEASLYPPWRALARTHGVRSALALPLVAPHDDRRGLFVLYADVPDYFGEVGIGLFESIAELLGALLSQARRHAQLERLARHDALTGLHNRVAAGELVAALRADRPEQPHSVLMIDLDRFKQVNDTHGHAAGDAVLVACVQRLRAALRHNDGLARWGGEEFLVWLPDTPRVQAQAVAQKLRQCMAGHALSVDGVQPIAVTGSIGVAEIGPDEPLEAAIARADQAMYASKQAGRNRVTVG